MNQKDFEPILTLSARELEVFTLMGEGKTIRQIARQLKLSIKTVESHRAHIYAKSGVSGSTAINHLATRFVIFCEQNKLKLAPAQVVHAPKLKFQQV